MLAETTTFILRCPRCQTEISYGVEWFGHHVDCPSCGSPLRLPSAHGPHEYLVQLDGAACGPYTVNQVKELWKQGKLKADGVFWTEFDGRLRPLAELWLEAPDFELATMRRIQVLDPTTGKMEGPFSFCDLKFRVDAAEVTPRHRFWWPGISHWLDFEVLGLVTEQDPNINYTLEKTISAPDQKEPPPFDRVMTAKGYLGAGLGVLAGYAIAFVILALVVLILLFLLFAG